MRIAPISPVTPAHNPPHRKHSHPWREGFCDGILGRASHNPYGFNHAFSMGDYLTGYEAGRRYRREEHIELTIERTDP